ncbi:hypothetical protein KUTeg_021368 [Tegillarca granosa]|uniref:BED-type domain-containing protein n=1 Tax=Tegillarca granosa TaxID=220873 RepID=A0ABQ9EEV2_TEGGR|nr:hypothetical protein KUTeg_021368 [Tegillarca granosa]
MADEKEIISFPGKAKSKVWERFGFYKDPMTKNIEKSHAVCKECRAEIKYSGNTSNLQYHIDKYHAKKLDSPNQPKQLPIFQSFANQSKLPFNSSRATAITKSIAEYLILEMKPLTTVESQSFKNMFKVTEPRYIVPSRSYFKETLIPSMYKSTKEAVIYDINRANVVSLTTDCWTSHATQAYMTVTAHAISPTWDLTNYVLQTRELPGSHTGELKLLQQFYVKATTPLLALSFP